MFNSEKFKELMDNKEFVQKMMAQDTPADVQKLFVENGVDATMEDVMKLAKALEDYADKDDELAVEDLDEVAGGIVIESATVWAAAKCVIAVGGAGLAVYKWYKSR